MSATTTLSTRQQTMARWLLHRDPLQAPAICATDEVDRDARLRVYADAYRLRLVEVLGQDFPALRYRLGENAFDALARDYLAAHPSRHPSVRHFGAHFPAWLETRTGIDGAMADLACVEWMKGEVFDAPDAPACGFDDLLAVPADAWPALRFTLHPALRRVRLRSNAMAMFDAYSHDVPSPEPQAGPTSTWLLWRFEFDVHWRRLPDDEAAAMDAVMRGDTFADCCEHLSGNDPALRAAALLKRWLADGWVTALSSAD